MSPCLIWNMRQYDAGTLRGGVARLDGWGELVSDVSKLLTGAFGEEFIRFVLNIPETENLDTLPDRIPAEVVQYLVSLAMDSASNGFSDVYFVAAGTLTSPVESEGTSLVHVLRKMCGGSQPETVQDSGDSLLFLLRCIARDCWPAYLLSPPNGQRVNNFFAASPSGIIRHPKASEAADVFMRDPSLGKLFPDSGDGERSVAQPLMESAEWVINVGSSGTRHFVGLLSGLLFDARQRVTLAGQVLTYQRLAESLEHSLAALRLLAEGKEVDVPAVIGFSGIAMEEGQSIRFTDGVLRG